MSSVYAVCWISLQTFKTFFYIQANSVDPDQTAPRGVCVCRGFTAQSTQWGHVERGQFT